MGGTITKFFSAPNLDEADHESPALEDNTKEKHDEKAERKGKEHKTAEKGENVPKKSAEEFEKSCDSFYEESTLSLHSDEDSSENETLLVYNSENQSPQPSRSAQEDLPQHSETFTDQESTSETKQDVHQFLTTDEVTVSSEEENQQEEHENDLPDQIQTADCNALSSTQCPNDVHDMSLDSTSKDSVSSHIACPVLKKECDQSNENTDVKHENEEAETTTEGRSLGGTDTDGPCRSSEQSNDFENNTSPKAFTAENGDEFSKVQPTRTSDVEKTCADGILENTSVLLEDLEFPFDRNTTQQVEFGGTDETKEISSPSHEEKMYTNNEPAFDKTDDEFAFDPQNHSHLFSDSTDQSSYQSLGYSSGEDDTSDDSSDFLHVQDPDVLQSLPDQLGNDQNEYRDKTEDLTFEKLEKYIKSKSIPVKQGSNDETESTKFQSTQEISNNRVQSGDTGNLHLEDLLSELASGNLDLSGIYKREDVEDEVTRESPGLEKQEAKTDDIGPEDKGNERNKTNEKDGQEPKKDRPVLDLSGFAGSIVAGGKKILQKTNIGKYEDNSIDSGGGQVIREQYNYGNATNKNMTSRNISRKTKQEDCGGDISKQGQLNIGSGSEASKHKRRAQIRVNKAIPEILHNLDNKQQQPTVNVVDTQGGMHLGHQTIVGDTTISHYGTKFVNDISEDESSDSSEEAYNEYSQEPSTTNTNVKRSTNPEQRHSCLVDQAINSSIKEEKIVNANRTSHNQYDYASSTEESSDQKLVNRLSLNSQPHVMSTTTNTMNMDYVVAENQVKPSGKETRIYPSRNENDYKSDFIQNEAATSTGHLRDKASENDITGHSEIASVRDSSVAQGSARTTNNGIWRSNVASSMGVFNVPEAAEAMRSRSPVANDNRERGEEPKVAKQREEERYEPVLANSPCELVTAEESIGYSTLQTSLEVRVVDTVHNLHNRQEQTRNHPPAPVVLPAWNDEIKRPDEDLNFIRSVLITPEVPGLRFAIQTEANIYENDTSIFEFVLLHPRLVGRSNALALGLYELIVMVRFQKKRPGR